MKLKLLELLRHSLRHLNVDHWHGQNPSIQCRTMEAQVFYINKGVRRASFTEITGLKFVDEVDNKKLVLGYWEILISKRKGNNKSVEPKIFKSKMDAVNQIESNQREALDLIKDSELLSFKKRKLVVQVDQLELEKTNYLMEKCLKYENTKYYNHWDSLLTKHLQDLDKMQNQDHLESTVDDQLNDDSSNKENLNS